MGETSRSTGVTVSASLVLLGSLFWLGMAIFMFVAVQFVPQLNDSTVRKVTYIFYGPPALIALLGMATAIGLYRLKPWSRISLLIFSGLIGISGLLLTTLFVWGSLSSPVNNPWASSILMMLLFFLPMVFFGFGWICYFNKHTVKEQFK